MSLFCNRPIHTGGCCCPHRIPAGTRCPACTTAVPLAAPPPVAAPQQPVIAHRFAVEGVTLQRNEDGHMVACLGFTFVVVAPNGQEIPQLLGFPFDATQVDALSDMFTKALLDGVDRAAAAEQQRVQAAEQHPAGPQIVEVGG